MPVSRRRKKHPQSEQQKKDAKEGVSPLLLVVGLAVALGVGTFMFFRDPGEKMTVTVTVPVLNQKTAAGQKAFNTYCADCHGENASGGSDGPPLIIPTYKPSHHADGAIRRAIALGVTRHHWRFGNMPPRPEVSGTDVNAIIAFIRATQKANGIF